MFIFRFGQNFEITIQASRFVASRMVSPFVYQDCAHPAAEGPFCLVLKFRQLSDQDHQHILDKVGRIVILKTKSPRPVHQQWSIKSNKPLPRSGIRGHSQSFQKTDARRMHETIRVKNGGPKLSATLTLIATEVNVFPFPVGVYTALIADDGRKFAIIPSTTIGCPFGTRCQEQRLCASSLSRALPQNGSP